MPWTTPTIQQVRQMVRDDITSSLYGSQVVGNTVLRVMGDAQAGLAALILRFLDWLARQLMPDQAETIWLDRHGQIWIQNSDGTTGRKNATASSGTVTFTGVAGIVVPAGTELVSPDGVFFQTLEFITLTDQPTEVAVRALNPGAAGNQPVGTALAMTTPATGVDSAVLVVDLRGGTEIESDEQLRARILARIRQPPMGGCAYDYEQWAMSIPSVTRAWCAPREMGMGCVTVRFMCDALRADTAGFPIQEDIDVVRNYLDTVRPVAVRDFFVESPVPEPIDFSLTLTQDSLALRAQVEDSVAAMIQEKANPAHQVNGELVGPTTIMASWIAEAVNRCTNDFDLQMDDHPMPHNGALATMGTITYVTPTTAVAFAKSAMASKEVAAGHAPRPLR
jgi:uncharacterized phage protein gp47/JayE